MSSSKQIPPLQCYGDLIASVSPAEREHIFTNNTEGVPYVALDNPSVKDTFVSHMLSHTPLTISQVEKTSHQNLFLINLSSHNHYSYPTMEHEDFFEEEQMNLHKGPFVPQIVKK